MRNAALRFSGLFLFFCSLTSDAFADPGRAIEAPPPSEASASEAPTAHPVAPPAESAFLRIGKDKENRPKILETSVVSFTGEAAATGKKGAPIQVDLISAVHIAELAYYQQLNKEFATYDAVLYELIAPEELSLEEKKALQTRGSSPSNPVSALQQTLQKVLGLAFQLENIDYTKKNMIHADLSPESFTASLESRGESIWSLFLRLLIQGFVEEQKRDNPFEGMLLMTAFLTSADEARPYVLRRYLAENFRELDSLVEKIEGPQGSTLVADRNQKALEVLRDQLKKGKKRIAIFYGAAHMPKFQESLERDFSMKKDKTHWLEAWHLQPPQGKTS